jgi:hypothetical protein
MIPTRQSEFLISITSPTPCDWNQLIDKYYMITKGIVGMSWITPKGNLSHKCYYFRLKFIRGFGSERVKNRVLVWFESLYSSQCLWHHHQKIPS